MGWPVAPSSGQRGDDDAGAAAGVAVALAARAVWLRALRALAGLVAESRTTPSSAMDAQAGRKRRSRNRRTPDMSASSLPDEQRLSADRTKASRGDLQGEATPNVSPGKRDSDREKECS